MSTDDPIAKYGNAATQLTGKNGTAKAQESLSWSRQAPRHMKYSLAQRRSAGPGDRLAKQNFGKALAYVSDQALPRRYAQICPCLRRAVVHVRAALQSVGFLQTLR